MAQESVRRKKVEGLEKRTLLLALDEGEESERALNWTLTSLIQPNDQLILLHAQPLPKLFQGNSMGPSN